MYCVTFTEHDEVISYTAGLSFRRNIFTFTRVCTLGDKIERKINNLVGGGGGVLIEHSKRICVANK
jgi:hypothetical protein